MVKKNSNNVVISGKYLSTMRSELGLSQQQIADASDVNRVSITIMEGGRSEIGETGLQRIQALFNCADIEEFIAKAERLEDIIAQNPIKVNNLEANERKGYYINLAKQLDCPEIVKLIEDKLPVRPRPWDPQILGPAIRNLREAQGMPTEELANKIFVDKTSLRNLELGKSLLRTGVLERIPKFLDCKDIQEVQDKGTELGPFNKRVFCVVFRELRKNSGLTAQEVADRMNDVNWDKIYRPTSIKAIEHGSISLNSILDATKAFGYSTPQEMIQQNQDKLFSNTGEAKQGNGGYGDLKVKVSNDSLHVNSSQKPMVFEEAGAKSNYWQTLVNSGSASRRRDK